MPLWENPAAEFTVGSLSASAEELYFAPAVFTFPRAAMAVTEVDLRDYPGWNFRRSAEKADTLQGAFAKFPTKKINQTWGKGRTGVTSETKRLRYMRVLERADYLVKTKVCTVSSR